MAGSYRDLGAWREGIALLAGIHLLVQRFPAHEKDFLAEQLFRAAVAVPARIAEGQESGDRAEFLRHLEGAAASLAETGALLATAEQLGYVTPGELEALEQARLDAASPLRGLIARIRRDLGLPGKEDAQAPA